MKNTDLASEVRTYAWEACGTYFLRCGGSVPEPTLSVIKRILKSTTVPSERVTTVSTALHRVSSDVQSICFLLEDGNGKYPEFPFDPKKADAIFAFYRDTGALS